MGCRNGNLLYTKNVEKIMSYNILKLIYGIRKDNDNLK